MGTKSASIVCVVLFAPYFAAAQVVISELLYDLQSGSDSGREWIEVYNEGDSAVDLTEWKFFEGNTNHGITATAGSELSPGAYAVIADNPAKFKADWPAYDGLLFDSAFSLNNSGESLGLRCCGKELTDKDSVSYSSAFGGAGDGASLSRSGGTFVPTDPTPGAPPSAARTASEPEPEPSPAETQKLPEPAVAPQPVPEPKTVAVSEEPAEHVAVSSPAPKKKSSPAPQPAVEPAEPVEKPTEQTQEESVSQVAAVAVMPDTQSTPWVWWAGAAGIALIGAGGAYVIGRRRSREWTIIEETGEDV